MQTEKHLEHVRSLRSYNTCQECKADCERKFNPRAPWHYDHVAFYLRFSRAGLSGQGVRLERMGTILDAKAYAREFLEALQRRIYLKGNPLAGRKTTSGYTERLGQWRDRQDGRYWADSAYLRQFAERKGYC